MAGTLEAVFVPRSFADLHGWAEDDHLAAFSAFRRSAFQSETKPYRSGSLGVPTEAFLPAYAEARASDLRDKGEARRFFEHHFRPFAIEPADRRPGLVTGFYEPVAEASLTPDARYRFPVYRRPDDLIDIDESNRPADMDPSFRFGRIVDGTIAEYPDRPGIENGALAGRGLEIAWLADRVDLFFIHIQGAARLTLPDGSTLRITYAAKSGHPFTGIGRVLADMGEIPLEKVTMQSIRAWLAANPDRINEILWQNRSFIFFRDYPGGDDGMGPIAAAKVPLSAGRSIAVDRLLHTFGTPFFIDAPTLNAFGGSGFHRLMIAQDTGTAIVGPARADLFTGSGYEAGEIAGVIRHEASFHMLVPKAHAETLK